MKNFRRLCRRTGHRTMAPLSGVFLFIFFLLPACIFFPGCQGGRDEHAVENTEHSAGEYGESDLADENGKEAVSEAPAGRENGMWMYAVNAGKADAILVGTEDAVCLIDAGYGRSRGKILAAMKKMGVEGFDAVFVTHTDKDHTDGLDWLVKSDIRVGCFYASAMFLDVKESKHPAVKAAKERGQEVVWLKAGDTVKFGETVFDVLAPFRMAEDKDDNNSLVMMLRGREGSVLLAGDMEFPEEEELLESGADIRCDVLKVANHGDDDTTSREFVSATQPKVAVISTSSREKPQTPDERSLKLLSSAGARTAVTEECSGGILVRLLGGEASVERVNLPEPETGVFVEEVVAGDDLIVLNNRGSKTENLSDWYLVSDRGREWFVFPEGTTIAPGQQLVIGTNSSSKSMDLLWDDKKVVHKSKKDVITLYDANGMTVSFLYSGAYSFAK